MRLWISGYHLGLPLAIAHWKVTVWKKLQLLLKFYKILFNSKCIWSCVCSMHNVTACKLMEMSAVKELPFDYSICLSQLKHQIKSFWLKASMLHEQLLSNVPYATLCPIRNDMFMIFAYWTIRQLVCSKIHFFIQI